MIPAWMQIDTSNPWDDQCTLFCFQTVLNTGSWFSFEKGEVGKRKIVLFSDDFINFLIILRIFNESGKLIMLLYPFSSTGADGI